MMKNGLASFAKRLTSRKFLVTVAGIVLVTLFPQQADNIITLIVTYNGAEGVADVVGRYAEQKTAQAKVTYQAAAAEYGELEVASGSEDRDIVSGNQVQ